MSTFHSVKCIAMVTPSHRQHATAVTAAVCSSLSMVGTLYILARYWHARSAAAKAATSRHVSSLRRIDVTQELIHVLAWIDLLGAFARVFGPLPTMTFNQKNGEPVTDVCRLQAFVLSFSDVSAVMWNFLMAVNMFRWVCLGEDQQRLQQTIKWYILWTMAFTITITGTALGSGVYGNAVVWCWVSIPNDPHKELIWKLGTLYVWIILLAIAMAVLLLLVKLNVQRRLDGVDSADARVAYKRVIHNLTVYIVAFIVCWTPAVVNRAHSYITGDHSFVLEILHASVVSLQGFVNALIYGKLHVWIGRHVKHTSGSLKQLNRPPRPAALPEHQDPRRLGVATIFVTTFDMNWSPLPSNLRDWIPPNKDVYSISLLHCANIDEVRLVLHKYLEQVNFPMSFHLTTSATGLTSRGTASDASLIQLLFINKSDIASGNVQFPPSFGERKSANSGFKDAVGTPLRYFDASIAFVSCDLRNLSGNGSLKNKHMQVARFLRSFAMGADRSAVEFPSLYHHTILSSALSYSLDVPHDDLTDAVSNAYEKQCLRQRRDDFMQQRPLHRASFSSDDQDATYDELYSSMENGVQFTQLQSPRGSDGADTSTQSTWSRERSWTQFLSAILPTPNTEAPPANNSRQDSTAMADRIVEAETAWRELTEHDELRQAMASQEVFCGFSEPSIEFLPTYPRLIGTGASYTLGVGNTMKNIFTGGSPEYSDRILTHSLPDTAQRLRRVTYAACEAIKSSSHKPVCSEFELEIDRFFAYVNSEVQRQDASVGATSLKDKSGVGEVKVTLKNLDVDLWATVAVNRNLRRSMHRLQRLRSSIMDKSLSPVGLRSPPIPESNRTVGDESPDVTNHVLSPEVFVSRRGTSEFDLEQIRVQSTHIATIFPLPSEDVYALQRKVYEVAHSVEKGFWASVEDGEGEEAILAYTNTRRTPWRGAVAHGVVHSAITKSVNGMFHIAVRVSGDSRDQYGQGILCIEESTLQQATTGVVVPFSIPLSCGGKHVGFLTGDVVM